MFIRSRSVLISLNALLFFISSVDAAEIGTLYPKFQGKTVRTYVAEVKDSTKDREADPKLIKAKIEDALKNRKSIHFEITQNIAEAEISVDAKVSEFTWSDHDPVDMLMGVGSAAMDAAVVEDYARLQADVTVMDAKSKKILWKDRVMGTVTKKPMLRKDSIPLVSESFAKEFIRDCFSKKRSN